MFNITNPEAVVLGSVPDLDVIGPFLLELRVVRHDISWETGNDIVQFKEWRMFYEDDASEVSLDLPITQSYSPYLLAAANGYSEYVDSVGLKKLFTTKTAREWLFGFEDDILAALGQIAPGSVLPYYGGLLGNASSPPGNNMGSGYNRMYTGQTTTYQARQYVSYGGMDQLYCCFEGPCGSAGPQGYEARPSWGAPYANTVSGGSGDQFRAGISSSDSLRVFVGGNTLRCVFMPLTTLF
jgi:hypothetical protein